VDKINYSILKSNIIDIEKYLIVSKSMSGLSPEELKYILDYFKIASIYLICHILITKLFIIDARRIL
jgi:hypothetical protein